MDQIIDIIRELKEKNYSRFEVFYHLTKSQVYFTILSIVKDQTLAEDLLQDTYMKFLEKIDGFKESGNPYAYLVTIGRNLSINLYHERKKEVISEEIFETIPSELEEDNHEEDIVELMSILDQNEREIVTMHVINDMKFKDIAVIMKKPLGTVLWIYNKAMKKLKVKVGERK